MKTYTQHVEYQLVDGQRDLDTKRTSRFSADHLPNVSVPEAVGNREYDTMLGEVAAGDAEIVEVDETVLPDYAELRRQDYPPDGDQLDALWKQHNQDRLGGKPLIQEVDDMLGTILAVKAAHPKPE